MISLLFCTLIFTFDCNARNILIYELFVQCDDAVENLVMFTVFQNSVLPNLFICVVSCGLNAVLHYGLVYQAKMGIQ